MHDTWGVRFCGLALAAAALAVGTSAARGEGSAAGELGAGGTATGDISLVQGEEDRVGIDLVQGSLLDVKFSSDFAATVELLDPSEQPVPLGLSAGPVRLVKGLVVRQTGRHHFRVASAGGSQGRWKLQAKPSWPASVALSGQTGAPLDVQLPAGASVKGTVSAQPAASFDPAITDFSAPDGTPLLAGPIAGRVGVAKLPKTVTTQTGTHRLAVSATSGDGSFAAALKVKAPKPALAKIDLSNGLTVTSFAADGVAQVFADRCVQCHPWASSYGGAKRYGRLALAQVRRGSMPQQGPPLTSEQTALLAAWVQTGMNP